MKTDKETYIPLSDNTRIRQVLAAQPPRIVHGTFYLFVALLVCMLIWSTFSRIDLIVKAPGRIRPKTNPIKVVHQSDSIRSSIAGKITQVHVQIGDRVKKGDILAEFDRQVLDNELTRLKRVVENRKSELDRFQNLIQHKNELYQTEVSKAEADLKQANEQIRREKEELAGNLHAAQVEYDAAVESESKKRKLVEQGLRPKGDLDQATIWLQRAKANLDKLKMGVDESRLQPLQLAIQSIKNRHDVENEDLDIKLIRLKEELHDAETQLANTSIDYDQAVVRAHIDGVVTEGEMQEGESVQAGQTIFTIAPEQNFQMEVLVASSDVGRIQVGMPSRIKLDAFDYQKYGTVQGKVEQVSPDSEMVKEAGTGFYRVHISIPNDQIGRGKAIGKIKLGMTGLAEIITDEDSILALTFRKIQKQFSIR